MFIYNNSFEGRCDFKQNEHVLLSFRTFYVTQKYCYQTLEGTNRDRYSMFLFKC
jgi:hypothetical protein